MGKHVIVILCLGLLACGETRPVTLGDSGPGRPDSQAADAAQPMDQGLVDASPLIPDGGGVVVVTDKKGYAAKEKVVGTVINHTSASIFLQGCSIFTWEKLLGGAWVDKGPTIMCGWEGYAKEVAAGSSLAEDQFPHGPGIWRLGALYGVGCLPNQPLSSAQCSATTMARSEPFTVGTTLEICNNLQSEYATALIAARKCQTTGTGQCEKKVSDDLVCGCWTYVQDDAALAAIKKQYADLSCNQPAPPCPPMPCPDVQGAGCIQGKCVDYLPD